jgi:hypothetical protein
MTQQEMVKLLEDIILNDKKHKWYHHTVKRAKEYRTFITGEGIEEHIPRFARREDQEAWQQRMEIMVNITETVCGSLIDPQYKLPRSNSVEKTLMYADNDQKKLMEITDRIATFWDGKHSVDRFMGKSWVELNNIDPNAFIAIDWKFNENGERIRPYPVEYPSEQVLHYNEVNGDLKWICVHRPAEYEDGFSTHTEIDKERFILYGKNMTVYAQRTEPTEWAGKENVVYYQSFPIDDHQGVVAKVKVSKDEFYDIYVSKPHGLGYVPGFHVGFVTDMSNRKTYLSFIHKAIPLLKKIVKANSEQDLTMAYHTFPQKIQYVDPCPECGGNGRGIDGTVCSHCNGSGVDKREVHTSAQDILLVPRPRDNQDIVDLSKFIHYVPNDINLVTFLDMFIDKTTKRCKEAVFNSEVFSRGQVAETAYAKNIDLQNVYDALWPMAEAYQYYYNFIVATIAKICDLNDGFVHRLSFRKDFKMKSLTDLYTDLGIVGTSQADEFVKKAIEDDIAQILYEDDPRELMKYKTMNHFFPFNGKGKDEIKMIVANHELTTEEVRVLWANFSFIFDEIELDYKGKKIDFYQLPRDKQKIALDAKVQDIIEKNHKQAEIKLSLDEDRTGLQEDEGENGVAKE